MGRFHCIDSDCAVVWVKIPGKGKQIIGDLVKFTYQNVISGFDQPDPYWRFQYANATGFTYIDNHPNRCYFGANETTRNNIPLALENNPEGNHISSIMDWDSIPTGTWQGTRRDEQYPNVERATKGIARVGHYHYARIEPDGTDGIDIYGEVVNGRAVVYWQGEVDYLFLSYYTDAGGTYRYDINVIEKDSCHISQVLVGGDFNLDLPDVFQVEKHDDYTSVLTLHNYQGMLYGGTDLGNPIIDTNRPAYLKLINPREIEDRDRWQAYKIEKLPYLERLEVVPFAYETLGFSLYQKDIPDECMNIYVNDVTGAITVPGIPSLGNPFYDSWKFIAQFCAEPGESPPEYYVVCGCEPQCPPGTCAVECGDHLCCYDSDGVAVASIPLT